MSHSDIALLIFAVVVVSFFIWVACQPDPNIYFVSCELCGAKQKCEKKNISRRIKNKEPSSCAACKEDTLAAWFGHPAVQEFVKTQIRVREDNAAAKLSMAVLEEIEEDSKQDSEATLAAVKEKA